jgi:DNA-binding NarL/FixJ family response regulator
MFFLADSFHSAAVGEASWESALRALARATGARSMQLTGTDPNDCVLFRIRTDPDPVFSHLQTDGAASLCPPDAAEPVRVLKVALSCDVPWLCLSKSQSHRKLLLSLAAVRNHEAGRITSEQSEIFSAAVLHVRSALRTHISLQHERFKQLTEILGALSIAVLVCDYAGKVMTLTNAAETLLTAGRGLQMVDGRIRASRPDDAEALSEAIAAVGQADISADCRLLRTVVVRGDSIPLVIDVFSLPSQHSLDLPDSTCAVMLVARGAAGGNRRKASILQIMYGLTGAETEIALHLAEGRTATVIASDRNVAIGTVRSQIKTLLAKMGVRRQVELSVRLSQL